MAINVNGRKLPITESLRAYTEEKIGNAMKAIDGIDIDADVVLRVERAHINSAICEVTIRPKGHIIHVEERDTDMHAAIDVAAAKVMRQLRKYKTRVVDHRMQETLKEAEKAASAGEFDADALMAELADDEIVRVKEVDFAPLTEEEALVQMDLIGHNFFVY
ncbi:MAG: ribosome-associated translation inhibitor RaiA, partial [Eggerthellaceae bacterium]|nr:ribosome-associated translation inhibitor RaiA [Eggerthellaceae bacterium]